MSKKEYDSDKRIECFYCGTSMKRQYLIGHTKDRCSKAEGRRPREKLAKGAQSLSDMFKKHKVHNFLSYLSLSHYLKSSKMQQDCRSKMIRLNLRPRIQMHHIFWNENEASLMILIQYHHISHFTSLLIKFVFIMT